MPAVLTKPCKKPHNIRARRDWTRPKGIIEKTDGKLIECAWDDVTAVHVDITEHYLINGSQKHYSHTTHVFRVVRKSGPRLDFDSSVENIEQLGAVLVHEGTSRQINIINHALNADSNGGKKQ